MAIAPVHSSPPTLVSPPGTAPGQTWLSDEPPLETYLHLQQLIALLTSLEWLWRDRTDFFAAGNLTVYYSPRQSKSEDFRGPDFFVVMGTERRPRNSWMVWEEGGRYPNMVVEVLSDSTASTDRSLKKQIYQDIWRMPYYFWFDPVSQEFEGFHLVDGHYEPIQPTGEGRMWCHVLGLYLGIHSKQLRFFTPSGDLVLTPPEDALAKEGGILEAQRQAELEKQRADQEQRRAERLAQQLRALGIEPDS